MNAMTEKERVRRAVAHQPTDRLPYSVHFTLPAYERMQAFCGRTDFYETLGSHINMFEYAVSKETAPGRFTDQFGVVWNRSGADKDIGIVENRLLPEPDLAGFSLPEIDEAAVRRLIEDNLRDHPQKFNAYCIGFSLFERAWTLCGMEDLLVYMVLEPQFVHALFEMLTDYTMRLLDIALEYPLDAVHFGDDWGQQKGMIMGPEHWRTFLLPCIKRLYGRVRAAGLIVSQHSCGDIGEVFGDLIDAGLQIYQTFQPEIYDVETVKATYGNDLTFWGGISTQQLLPTGSPEEVYQETKRLMECLSVNGGYIVAPTHAVPADVPPENVMAMLRAVNPELAQAYPSYFSQEGKAK